MTELASLHRKTVWGVAIILAVCLTARAGEKDSGDTTGLDAAGDLQRISNAIAKVSEAVKPSVVHIRAKSVNKTANRELRRMFKDENLPPMPTIGTGSGIVLDTEGHIVTNNHVVSDAKKVYVTLADGRMFTAQVIGTDPKTDLAVLQIQADNLQPAKLADSDRIRVGELVLAIGSPFRLGHSISHGIVSAIGRSEDSIDVDIAYKNWIQTDAPINPGNSGGPLINARGEVIGINVAIATDSGGHQGVSFAIPSNTVSRIATMLRNGETIVRGYLGVMIKPVDDRVADAYDLPEVTGAFIEGVADGSPAGEAGLKAEDIVLAVNSKPVKSQADLQELIATFKPGSEIPMTIWRHGNRDILKVTVGMQPDGFSTRGSLSRPRGDPHAREQRGDPHFRGENADDDDEEEEDDDDGLGNGRFGYLGFEVEAVNASMSRKDGQDSENQAGVIVTRVDPTSEAFDAGLRPKQVITRANDKPIKSVKDLQDMLTTESIAKGVRLKYRSGGEDGYLVLRVR